MPGHETPTLKINSKKNNKTNCLVFTFSSIILMYKKNPFNNRPQEIVPADNLSFSNLDYVAKTLLFRCAQDRIKLISTICKRAVFWVHP